MTENCIIEKFPLHFYVWKNDVENLEKTLGDGKFDLEKVDLHGCTPLMMAVKLNHDACVNTLLSYGAKVFGVHHNFWTLEQEAVSTGNYQLIKAILGKHEIESRQIFYSSVQEFVNAFESCSDLYFEMKLDFSTWLPTITSIFPCDTCKIWKKGSNIRIDANLVNFKGTSPYILGKMSYILSYGEDKNYYFLHEINNSTQTAYVHKIPFSKDLKNSEALGGNSSNEHDVLDSLVFKKLSMPSYVTVLENCKLEYSKSKTGSFVWSSDMKETINGLECHVFRAKDIQMQTIKRSEHNQLDGSIDYQNNVYNPHELPIAKYFSVGHGDSKQLNCDIGRVKALVTKTKTFKSSVWLSNGISKEVKNQVLGIIDLLAKINPVFAKISYYMHLNLPEGFPVKIEIPLYLVLFCTVTFSNFFGRENTAKGVHFISENSGSNESTGTSTPLVAHDHANSLNYKCKIEDSLFKISPHLVLKTETGICHYGSMTEQDLDFQSAMSHLLEEFGTTDCLVNRQYSLAKHEVSKKGSVKIIDEDEALIQDAIAESLASMNTQPGKLPEGLSEAEKTCVLMARKRLEEEQFEKALELSKVVK